MLVLRNDLNGGRDRYTSGRFPCHQNSAGLAGDSSAEARAIQQRTADVREDAQGTDVNSHVDLLFIRLLTTMHNPSL